MKFIKYLLILSCLVIVNSTHSQTSAYLIAAAKLNVNNVTGTNPYTLTVSVTDDLSRFTIADFGIGDSVYLIDGSDLLIYVVTNKLTSPDRLVVNDVNNTGINPPNGQGAIVKSTSNYKLPVYISSLRNDLQSMIQNRFSQLLDNAIYSAKEISYYIGSGVPVFTPTSTEPKLAQGMSSPYPLYNWNGTSWILVGSNTAKLDSNNISKIAVWQIANKDSLRSMDYKFDDITISGGTNLAAKSFDLVTNPTGKITASTSGGNVRYEIDLVGGTPVTNGLSKNTTTNTIKLGGTLTEPTTITTDATNKLNIVGLQSSTAASDSVVMVDAVNGQLRRRRMQDLVVTGGGGSSNTFADSSQVSIVQTGTNVKAGLINESIDSLKIKNGSIAASDLSQKSIDTILNLRQVQNINVALNSTKYLKKLTQTKSKLTKLRILFIGDSNTGRDAFTTGTMYNLRQSLGIGGIGFLGFSTNQTTPLQWIRTRTGTITDYTYTVTPNVSACLDAADLSAGATVTFANPIPSLYVNEFAREYYSKDVTIFWEGTGNSADSFNVKINGAYQSVQSAGAVGLRSVSISITNGYNEIKISNSGTGTIRFYGINVENDVNGLVASKLGANGSNAWHWNAMDTSRLMGQIRGLNPDLIIVNLGSNAFTTVDSMATYFQTYKAFQTKLVKAGTNASFLHIAPTDRNTSTYAIAKRFQDSLYKMCLDSSYGFGSLLRLHKSWSEGNKLGYFDDGVHYNVSANDIHSQFFSSLIDVQGGKAFGDISTDRISISDPNQNVLIGRNIKDLTPTSGTQNVIIGNVVTRAAKSTGGIFLGYAVADDATTLGNKIIGIGYNALNNVTTVPANSISIGEAAGRNSSNTSPSINIGLTAGQASTGTGGNIFFGDGAGLNAVTASYNYAFGTATFSNTNNTSFNNAFGRNVMIYAANANYNNVFGSFSGTSMTGDNNNIFGSNIAGTLSGSNNTLLGSNMTAGTFTNTTGLGYQASPTKSNQIVYGNGYIVEHKMSGVGSVIIPVGNTAQRPSTPSNGMIRFNTSLNVFEGYVTSSGKWEMLSQPSPTSTTITSGTSSTAAGAFFQITTSVTTTGSTTASRLASPVTPSISLPDGVYVKQVIFGTGTATLTLESTAAFTMSADTTFTFDWK